MISTNNLKQIALAFQGYHEVHHRFPGNGVEGEGTASPDAAADGTALYQVLPYIEQDALFRSPNSTARVMAYLEPSRRRPDDIAGGPPCDYAVNLCALYGTVKPTAENVTATLRNDQFHDGTSNTILAGGKAMNPRDYATADRHIDESFLARSAAGSSRATARYTVGVTTELAALTSPPPVEFVAPRATRDLNAPVGLATDLFGGPYPAGTQLVFADGSVRSLNYAWTDAEPTVVLTPTKWGTPPTEGVFDRVSPFRAALTPNGGESFQFE